MDGIVGNVIVGKCVAIEGINSSVQALKNKSAVAAENFIVAVEDINTRWNKLVDGIFDREVSYVNYIADGDSFRQL